MPIIGSGVWNKAGVGRKGMTPEVFDAGLLWTAFSGPEIIRLGLSNFACLLWASDGLPA